MLSSTPPGRRKALGRQGEGYHHYHHMYQSDYRNGLRWYNFDPSKWLIYILSVIGLATSLRTALQHQRH